MLSVDGPCCASLSPDEVFAMLYEGGRFRFTGREVFRAFWYKPHALQIVAPFGERRQSGVRVVPQLLQRLVFLHRRAESRVSVIPADLSRHQEIVIRHMALTRSRRFKGRFHFRCVVSRLI